MTTVVAMPGITETYKRALYEVVSQFFDGADHEVNCSTQAFPEADVVFDVRRLGPPLEKPVICFTGFIERGYSSFKTCETKPGCDSRPAYEHRCQTTCLVIVSVPLEEEEPVDKSKRTVDRIYDLLTMLFKTEKKAFSARNIFETHLSSLATENPDTEYGVVSGRLFSQLRYVTVVTDA